MKTNHQAGKKSKHSKARSQAALSLERHQRRMERIEKAIRGATEVELINGQVDDLRKLQRFVSKYYRIEGGNEEPMMDLAYRMYLRFNLTNCRLNECRKGGAQ